MHKRPNDRYPAQRPTPTKTSCPTIPSKALALHCSPLSTRSIVIRFEQSHIGLCVSDLQRSLTFYRDGLGFEEGPEFSIDYPISEMTGEVELISKFLHSGDLRIELLAFATPEAFGTPSASRNQRGLTHLSFTVDDLDAAADHLVRHGGRIIEGTRATPEGRIHIVFLADPDGTRIELMKQPEGVIWPWY